MSKQQQKRPQKPTDLCVSLEAHLTNHDAFIRLMHLAVKCGMMEHLVEDLANANPGGSIDWAIVRANEIVDAWRGVGKPKAETKPEKEEDSK